MPIPMTPAASNRLPFAEQPRAHGHGDQHAHLAGRGHVADGREHPGRQHEDVGQGGEQHGASQIRAVVHQDGRQQPRADGHLVPDRVTGDQAPRGKAVSDGAAGMAGAESLQPSRNEEDACDDQRGAGQGEQAGPLPACLARKFHGAWTKAATGIRASPKPVIFPSDRVQRVIRAAGAGFRYPGRDPASMVFRAHGSPRLGSAALLC